MGKEIKQFANEFDLSAAFVRRLKILFMRLETGSLKPKEYQEYRDKCERFASSIISKLKDSEQ